MGLGLLLVLVMAPVCLPLQFVSEHNLHTKCQPLNVNTSCDESSPISKAQVVNGLYYHKMA